MHSSRQPLFRTHLPHLHLEQQQERSKKNPVGYHLHQPTPPSTILRSAAAPPPLDLQPIDVFKQCLRVFLQYHDVYGPLMELFMHEYNLAVGWYAKHKSHESVPLFKNIDEANRIYRTQTENVAKAKEQEAHLKQLEEETRHYALVIADFENQVLNLQRQNENLQDEMEDLKMTNHVKVTEIKDMQNQILQLRSLNRQLQEVNDSFADNEYMELTEQNLNLGKRVEQLEKELREAIQKSLQLTDLLSAGAEIKRTQDDTIKDLHIKLKEKSKQKKELEDQIKLLVSESRDYEHQIVKLRASLATQHPDITAELQTPKSSAPGSPTGGGWVVKSKFKGGNDEMQNYVIELWQTLSRTADLNMGVLTWSQIRSVWTSVDPKIEPELDQLLKVLGIEEFPERIPVDTLLQNLKGIFRYSSNSKSGKTRRRSQRKSFDWSNVQMGASTEIGQAPPSKNTITATSTSTNHTETIGPAKESIPSVPSSSSNLSISKQLPTHKLA